jgi:hypothetical protein
VKRSLLLALALAGCAGSKPIYVTATVMMRANAREPGCALQFVEASIMDMSPMGKYDVLGYVQMSHLQIVDPLDESNRVAARPKACAMGGQYISLPLANTTQTHFVGNHENSTVIYAVLRDKSTAPAAAPQPF